MSKIPLRSPRRRVFSTYGWLTKIVTRCRWLRFGRRSLPSLLRTTLVFLSNKCNGSADSSSVPMSNRPQRHIWSCPKAPVACPHTTRGCAIQVPREDLASHLQSCTFEHLSAFFTMNDARHQSAEDRLTALESTVTNLEMELAATKADLANARYTIAFLRGKARDSWIGNGPPTSLPFSEDDPIFADFFPPPMAPSTPTAPAATAAPDRQAEDPTTPQNRPRELPSISDDPRASVPLPIQRAVSPSTSILAPPIPSLSTSPGSPNSTARSPATPNATAPSRPGITDRAAADIRAQAMPRGFSSHDFMSGDASEPRQSYADEVFERLPVGLPPPQAMPAVFRILVRLALGMDRIERRSQT